MYVLYNYLESSSKSQSKIDPWSYQSSQKVSIDITHETFKLFRSSFYVVYECSNKGSIVRLSVCSRHEGASFIVVKDLKNARRCSYLGELDSDEESDEISDEFEFTHNITPDERIKYPDEQQSVFQY